MKNAIKNRGWLYIVMLLLALTACETNDNEKEWGIPKIYMPQAAIVNGGLTPLYPVPLGNNPSTENYVIDSTTNTLKITLGVYRSGLQPLESYAVSVKADIEATDSAVTTISRGVVLPADVYSLPSSISVPDGEREAIFTLDVDLNKLIENYPDYGANKFVLVVAISDPTKYELNPQLSKTIVVIDGPSFLPAPKIVKGGDFEPGSESNWTIINADYTLEYHENIAVIANGFLKLDYGSDQARGAVSVYQKIELEQGKSYKLSADFSSSGGVSTFQQFIFSIDRYQPQEGVRYNPQRAGWENQVEMFCWIDNFQGGGLGGAPLNGTLPQVAPWVVNIDKGTGVFQAKFSGDAYIIIYFITSRSAGTITLDNISVEEV